MPPEMCLVKEAIDFESLDRKKYYFVFGGRVIFNRQLAI